MGEGASQRRGLDGLGIEFGESSKLVHYGVPDCKEKPIRPDVRKLQLQPLLAPHDRISGRRCIAHPWTQRGEPRGLARRLRHSER